MTDQKPSSPTIVFSLGDTVRLRSQPEKIGAVVFVEGSPPTRYTVLLDGVRKLFYPTQLEAFLPVEETTEPPSVSEFGAHLAALQILHPSTSSLYSLHAARVNFVPYQFRPVMKLVRAERPRLLIADEVGVGKTIEAGLILRELQARQDLNRVLIICPRPLVLERKWQHELLRFDEKFEHLDGPKLRHCLTETDRDGLWPEMYSKAILPHSLFSEELLLGSAPQASRSARKRIGAGGLLQLDPPPRFDLIIVDEAHHLRNSDTWLHRGVKFFCDHAEAVIFLTATPIQLGDQDLYTLLNLLRPDWVSDNATFQKLSEPNPALNQAVLEARVAQEGWQVEAAQSLEMAAQTEYGHAILTRREDFKNTCAALRSREFTAAERLALIRQIEEWHTFAPLINRTRRRDIGNFTTRRAETIPIPFTPRGRALHDALLEVQARIWRTFRSDVPLGFILTTLQRQAASCIYGLAPLIGEILSRHFGAEQAQESAGDAPDISEEALSRLEIEISEVLRQARELETDPNERDPKLKNLLQIVRDKESHANARILLFSSFRHTLYYLERHLQNAGVRVGLIHGDVADEERSELRERFALEREDPKALEVLLSSEVGCEGLDYQFCDCLVNYDLPWNPMRVEQRIGRIDRYGQQSETVAILNFLTPETVDFDIYDRCLSRIGVFERALGGSEVILGEITNQIRKIAESLELSPEERRQRLEQIADNEIRLVQEQTILEDQQQELFGLSLPPEQLEREIKEASNPYLAPAALRNLVEHYARHLGSSGTPLQGAPPLQNLLLNGDARAEALGDFRGLGMQNTPVAREWERFLKGPKAQLAVTFDAQAAAQKREVTFLTPVHPFVMCAARWMNTQHRPLDQLFYWLPSNSEIITRGPIAFGLYNWTLSGLRQDALLQVVANVPEIEADFWRLLSRAQDFEGTAPPLPFDWEDTKADLENRHFTLWQQSLQDHHARVQIIAEARRQSLKFGHEARLNLLRDQLSAATNEKIQRMRQSQLDTAQADFTRRWSELETATSRADILSEPIAFGVLWVE